jgi:hypothetical protein
MVEQDWTPAMVRLGHLQSLANQGFMTVMELTACRVLEDPAFLAPVEGYMVTFLAFTSRDLVHYRISSSACCCGTMAWSNTI